MPQNGAKKLTVGRMPRGVSTFVMLMLSGLTLFVNLIHASDVETLVARFGTLPDLYEMTLSPDGKRIAVLRPAGGAFGLTIIDLEAGSSRLILAAEQESFLLNRCEWANNKRLLCSVRAHLGLTRTHYGGDSLRFHRLFAVDTDGQNFTELLRSPKERRALGENLARSEDRIVSWLPDQPDHVLLQLPGYRGPEIHALDHRRNRSTRQLKARDSIYQWFADRSGDVRIGYGFDLASRRLRVFNREPGKRQLKEVDGPLQQDRLGLTILGFDTDQKHLIVLARPQGGTRQIFRVDPYRFQNDEPLVALAGTDILAAELLTLRDTGEVVGVTYLADRSATWFRSPRFANALAELNATLPQRNNVPVSLSGDGSRWIVYSAKPHHPWDAYLYDMERKQLTRLGNQYPQLEAKEQPATALVHYRSGDGLEIPAYLTLPPGRAMPNFSAGKLMPPQPQGPTLPLVVLPHGGPASRDTEDFHYVSSFLGAAGFAVLRPQYRGSRGFGSAFEQAGRQQWGESMHDDVIAGLRWLRSVGIADPDRACIVGAEYGGYEALLSAYTNHEELSCAVSFAGIASLRLLLREQNAYFLGSEIMREILLDMRDWDRVVENSPITHVARFGTPLLLLHGDKDAEIAFGQVEALRKALDAADKRYRFVHLKGSDHFLEREMHRKTFLREMLRFLRRHLNGSG